MRCHCRSLCCNTSPLHYISYRCLALPLPCSALLHRTMLHFAFAIPNIATLHLAMPLLHSEVRCVACAMQRCTTPHLTLPLPFISLHYHALASHFIAMLCLCYSYQCYSSPCLCQTERLVTMPLLYIALLRLCLEYNSLSWFVLRARRYTIRLIATRRISY